MNNNKSNENQFVCSDCTIKYQIPSQTVSSEEEVYCLTCVKLNITKDAKCLYKGQPSCYECAISHNRVMKKSFLVHSNTITSPLSKRLSIKVSEFNSEQLNITKKSDDDTSILQSLEEPLNKHRTDENLFQRSVSNINYSMLTPRDKQSKGFYDFLSSSKLSSKRISKGPLDKLVNSIETLVKGNNSGSFNEEDIFYPLVYERHKDGIVLNKSQFSKGNFLILFKSENEYIGAVVAISGTSQSAKFFKFTVQEKTINLNETIFEKFTVDESQICFGETVTFNFESFSFKTEENETAKFIEPTEMIKYIKIYEIF